MPFKFPVIVRACKSPWGLSQQKVIQNTRPSLSLLLSEQNVGADYRKSKSTFKSEIRKTKLNNLVYVHKLQNCKGTKQSFSASPSPVMVSAAELMRGNAKRGEAEPLRPKLSLK